MRVVMLLVATAIIVLILPRNDRASFAYEQGQPWRYTLLTAPFDIPVYLDSTTYNRQSDSIQRAFVPYVVKADSAELNSMRRLELRLQGPKVQQLKNLMATAYSRGVMPTGLKKRVAGTGKKQVRVMTRTENTAFAMDASDMLSRDEALKWIVDTYGQQTPEGVGITERDVEALRESLTPNVLSDTVLDRKFLEQELQAINSGQGKIRQGQRIVDRGEIITPQVYTNLKTYEEMLEKDNAADRSHSLEVFAGQLVYLLMTFVVFFIYLRLYRPRYYANMRVMAFLMTLLTVMTVVAAALFESFTLGVYLTPFAIVPVVVLIFLDSRTAIISLIVQVLIAALIATYQFSFIVTELAVGIVATFSVTRLTQRSQLLRTSALVFLMYAVMGFVMLLVTGGKPSDFDPRILLAYGVNAVLFNLVYLVILLVEKVFGFTSAVTLVELSDINNQLLRRLSEEAPGTFQHSIQVSTLAADAARAIGADTQLVRTGALYHDIGKLSSPIFFTENQHGVNPHAGLDPQMSARKIISHVSEGVSMAERAKLPAVIRRFITEHHGRGLTRYFYNTAVNNSADGKVDAAPFTYPGPNPQSKETAIVMMADSVEAASRSLKEYTPEAISALVDKIIDGQIKDGLLKESPISFADIETIKDTFKKRLSVIYHTRVAYPERKG